MYDKKKKDLIPATEYESKDNTEDEKEKPLEEEKSITTESEITSALIANDQLKKSSSAIVTKERRHPRILICGGDGTIAWGLSFVVRFVFYFYLLFFFFVFHL
ncbi:hypothetical protein RFI_13386 [Reticulomyxa filosa]|uniref:DAGKc domain-containing protein n=1 Tax=Reticulomyxa filosa TaxID=46433 RepID=X6NDE6_RETFI|nr:hypothetical protein RFI_13386 [Reticulomyxa filosa]|eukprot:ETO23789.1 hypothetical protein RFI_13386 [Reticulomyxa filosa]